MPTSAVHRLITYLLTGDAGAPINFIIDVPSKILGPRHRILFHDPLQITLLSLILSGGSEKEFLRNFIAGHIHLAVDIADTIFKRTIRNIIAGGKRGVSRKRNKRNY